MNMRINCSNGFYNMARIYINLLVFLFILSFLISISISDSKMGALPYNLDEKNNMLNLSISTIPSLEWQKCYGGTGGDHAYSIIPTNDGGFITIGRSYSNNGDVSGNHGLSDYWVVKLTSTGSITWQKSLGGTFDDGGTSIYQTADGGYIVTGSTESNNGDVSGNHGGSDFWVVKLTNTGSISWQKCLGGSSGDYGSKILQTPDGGFIVAGTSSSNNYDVSGNHGASDYWVVKLTSTGSISWQKCIGGVNDDNLSDIILTTDGGYIAIGWTLSNNGDVSGNHGGPDYWVVKLSSDGSVSWQKCLGGSSGDYGSAIIQTYEGGYIVTGNSLSNDGDVSGNHGGPDYWVVKLTSGGSVSWQKCLGGSSYDDSFSIVQTQDNGYIVAGRTNSNNGDVSNNHGDYDYWVVKLTNNGVISWQKCFGGSNQDAAFSVIYSRDGGFVVGGFALSNNGDVSGNHGDLDYWIIKIKGQSIDPPAAPILDKPGDSSAPGREVDSLTPTLYWKPVQNADNFGIFISEYPYGRDHIVFDSILEGKNIPGSATSFPVPSRYLNSGKKYCWNMNAWNQGGTSPYSSPLFFQTKSLPVSHPIIADINPKEAKQNNKVTLTIAGSGFNPNAHAILICGNNEISGTYTNVDDTSTTLVRVFDLQNAPSGLYDLVVKNTDNVSSPVRKGIFNVNPVIMDGSTITESLTIHGNLITGGYVVGDFIITNKGTEYVHYNPLLIGGRYYPDKIGEGDGKLPDSDNYPNFPSTPSMTLAPGQSYRYSYPYVLPDCPGKYHFFCAYSPYYGDPDGWNVNVPTESGVVREFDITVNKPTLDTGFSPNPNGYQFKNYGAGENSWNFFKETYGDEDTEYMSQNGFIQRNKGAEKFYLVNIKYLSVEGQCYGNVMSSNLLFINNRNAWALGKDPYNNFIFKDLLNPSAASFLFSIEDVLRYYHCIQPSTDVQGDRLSYNELDPIGTSSNKAFNYLKSYILSGNSQKNPLGLGFHYTIDDPVTGKYEGNHIIIPVALDLEKGELYIFDNNYPGEFKKIIFDLVEDKAVYKETVKWGLLSWDAKLSNLEIVHLSSALISPKIAHTEILSSISNNYAHMFYTDSKGGHLGYNNGEFYNEISNATKIVKYSDDISEKNLIEMYYLNNISIKREIIGNSTGNVSFSMFGNNSLIDTGISVTKGSVHEINASAENSSFKIISQTGPTALNLTLVRDSSDEEKIVSMNGLYVGTGDNFETSFEPSNNTLEIINPGSDTQSRLKYEERGFDPISLVIKDPLPVEDNSRMKISINNSTSNKTWIVEYDSNIDGTINKVVPVHVVESVSIFNMTPDYAVHNQKEEVSCEITGLGLSNVTRVQLQNPENGNIITKSLGKISPAKMNAVFNVSSADIGRYDLVTTSSDDQVNYFKDMFDILPNELDILNASFISSRSTNPFEVSFTDRSTGSPKGWYWDFGDGTNATIQNPTHIYPAYGNYTVSLLINDDYGTDYLTKEDCIVIQPLPFSCNITTNISQGGSIFPDGKIEVPTGSNQSFIIAADPGFEIYQVLIDNHDIGPIPGYSFTNVVRDHTIDVMFGERRPGSRNISSTANKWAIVSPSGNHSYGAGSNATYLTESKPGADLEGVSIDTVPRGTDNTWKFTDISSNHTLTVNGTPSPGQIHVSFNATPTTGTPPLEVSFRDQSIGDPTSWYWQFGDGGISSEKDPVHQYKIPGIFTVSLRAYNNQTAGYQVMNNFIQVKG